jgi:septal ring factor EnvC (AmiA/AmiB activator)
VTVLRRLLVVLVVLAAAALGVAVPGRARAQSPYLADLLPIDPRLADVERRVAEALARVERLQSDRARVDAEVAGLGERRAAARGRLRDRARALYRLTRAGMLPMAGGFDALLGHFGRVERLRRMVRDDLGSIIALDGRGGALRAEASRLATAVEDARAEMRALQAREQALAEEEELSDSFDAAFESSTGLTFPAPVVTASGYGSLRVVDEDPAVPAETFSALRGRLSLPVGSATVIRDAARESGRGVEVVSGTGAAVRAVADGRIAFSDAYGAYGRLVIVDHGGGYFTVYGGLGGVLVRVGDPVARGGRLGDVASGALYFEVRRGSQPLDARSWLGI